MLNETQSDEMYILVSELLSLNVSCQDTGGLQSLLKIAVGCRVMLRINMEVTDGLVNGACGYIDLIEATEAREVRKIHVKFDGNAGNRWCTAHAVASVDVPPHTVRFYGKDGKIVRRKQFPLVLAWAKTIHKSQGATEHFGVRVALDKKVRMPGQAYVALSRSPALKLVSLDAFSKDSIFAMDGIEWSLNELYLQQARARRSNAKADRLAEEVLRPPQTVEFYESQRRALPKPDWLRYSRHAEDWQDLPDDFNKKVTFKCPRCGEVLESINAQRQHNRTCTAKKGRKRAVATSTRAPLQPQKLKRSASAPRAATTHQSASAQASSTNASAAYTPPIMEDEEEPVPLATAVVRWRCDTLECGVESQHAPEWFNPRACDAVSASRQQIGSTCGFLAALHALAAAGVQPEELTMEHFRAVGRAPDDEKNDYCISTINNFLNHHELGLMPIHAVNRDDDMNSESTIALLLLYPMGRHSLHWIVIMHTTEPGHWLLCDSMRSKPFEVSATHLKEHASL